MPGSWPRCAPGLMASLAISFGPALHGALAPGHCTASSARAHRRATSSTPWAPTRTANTASTPQGVGTNCAYAQCATCAPSHDDSSVNPIFAAALIALWAQASPHMPGLPHLGRSCMRASSTPPTPTSRTTCSSSSRLAAPHPHRFPPPGLHHLPRPHAPHPHCGGRLRPGRYSHPPHPHGAVHPFGWWDTSGWIGGPSICLVCGVGWRKVHAFGCSASGSRHLDPHATKPTPGWWVSWDRSHGSRGVGIRRGTGIRAHTRQ